MQQTTSVNAMAIQLNFLQTCILALRDKFGEDQTGQMLDQVIGTLEKPQAVVVNLLVKAMRGTTAIYQ